MKELAKLVEKQLLIALLNHEAGYGIQINGFLEIRVLEDRRFAVCEFFVDKSDEFFVDKSDYDEKLFNNVEEAVDSFLEIRNRRQLGLDFENWQNISGLDRKEKSEKSKQEMFAETFNYLCKEYNCVVINIRNDTFAIYEKNDFLNANEKVEGEYSEIFVIDNFGMLTKYNGT